jgi:hypothetical protein
METKQVFDCRNTEDQNQVAIHHRLNDPATFEQYLINFWGRSNVPSVRKSWEFISISMFFQNCNTRKWAFNADENDTTNNEIEFGFEDIPPHPIVTNYSIALFKGIHNLDDPTDFHFYKAKDNTGRFTVIFKVFCSDGTVKFYDLSNDFP